MRVAIVKKFMIIGGVVVLLIIVLCYRVFYSPVKYALKQTELDALNDSYYLVQWTQATGSSWKIIGDQDGYFDREVYIIAKGEVPSIVNNYDIATGQNTYICYGYYAGETRIDGNEMLGEYQFSGWDVLFPVKRNGLSLLPKSYLCKYDYK